MIHKNHILKLLNTIVLVVLISGYNYASINHGGLLNKTKVKSFTNEEKHRVVELESLSEITAVLETSVKLAETNFRSEENFKSGKRVFSVKLALQITGISKATFLTYSSKRDKSDNIFPLYISHRRLLI